MIRRGRDDVQAASLSDAGVTLVGYGVVPPRQATHAANRRIFEFAKAMGLEYLSADPDPAGFDDLDKLVETFGIAVGIHNHGPGPPLRQDRHDQQGDQGPSSEDRLLHRHRPLPALQGRPGPRGRGLRQPGLRRPLERRQGRQRPSPILGQGDLRTVDFLKALAQEQVQLLPGDRIRREATRIRSKTSRLAWPRPPRTSPRSGSA